MRKSLFRAILAVGLAALLMSCALLCPALARHFTEQVYQELETQARLAVQGVVQGGLDYLTALDIPDRVTWIAVDGTVLFDSAAAPADMENHLAREEIRQALDHGVGRASRQSGTMSVRTMYVALALTDGSVLRLASSQRSGTALLISLLPSLALILMVTAALAVLLAHRLSRRITRPILELDLDRPEACDTYEELTPLLRRLHAQNETIRAQLAALERQRKEFTAITENMSEGFLLVDSRTDLLSYNTGALRLLGAETARPGESVLCLSRAEPFRRVVDEALAGHRSEALLERTGRICQLLASPVIQGDQVLGAVIAILDVTEREERETLRREFTANVSHELKTPLTSISGFAELMMNGLVPPETVPEFAADIHRESQRLIALVEDIIHLSQLDEGLIPAGQESVDLAELAGDVLGRLSPAAQRLKLSLRLEGGGVSVQGPRQVLDELIFNLADNAVKYNRPGGSVTISVDRRDGAARLTVSDTGAGIPAECRERVFERFYRVDKSRSKEVGGTGLGLSIVKHAAAYLGAQVTLESAVGVGTTVTVVWPHLPGENAST